MSVHTIVTHPGGAHKDEFLACSLMAAQHNVPIERREPGPDDLGDPAVCVIDVGGQHEPELNNFDHHQFPIEGTPTCALSLVLQHFGLYEDARAAFDWLEPTEWFDVLGPTKTADRLGVPRKVVSQLVSPIDHALLRRFAGSVILREGDALYDVMRLIGSDMLSFLQTLHKRMQVISRTSEMWTVEVGGESFGALFLPRRDPITDEPSMGLGQYVALQGLEESVAALVYPDRRSEGYGMSRYQDHPRLDFTRTQRNGDVHFAHASGFLAKTSATEPTRLRELLAQAWH